MALLRYNRYPGYWLSPTTSYPQGAFKNKSSDNADDGSYAEADWLNDWDGFFSRLLGQAGVSPNGVVDTALSSQYYDALMTLVSNRVPTGMYIYTAGLITSNQFLLANGDAVSRTTYAALFKVIGTTYGAGDGSTTFNLPDQRGEFMRGADLGRGVDAGRTIGSKQADSFRAHNHPINTTSSTTNTSVNGDPARGSIPGSQNSRGGLGEDMSIAMTGGTETRPRNVASVCYIKI